jgi:hypothetical protein
MVKELLCEISSYSADPKKKAYYEAGIFIAVITKAHDIFTSVGCSLHQ